RTHKELIGKTKSQDVVDLLNQHLPQRGAAKLIEMQAESDRRFADKAMGQLGQARTDNKTAYVMATSDAGRADAVNRHLNLLGIMKQTGVLDNVAYEKERLDFMRDVETFAIEKRIEADYKFGAKALTNPSEVMSQYPHFDIKNLDQVYAKSV